MAKQNKPSLGTTIRQNSSGVLAALMCIVIGLVIGLIALFIINPEHALVDGFWRILQGGFYDFPYGCGKVLTQTAPLIMTGLSVAFTLPLCWACPGGCACWYPLCSARCGGPFPASLRRT